MPYTEVPNDLPLYSYNFLYVVNNMYLPIGK